jgi:ACS family hexuronate transporter-like MFS transporter
MRLQWQDKAAHGHKGRRMRSRYRFVIMALLFLAGVINYMDRSALGIAAPIIAKELSISPSMLGIIFSSFFATYALFNFVGGVLSDRFGTRRVFAGAMALWSICCGLTGLMTSFSQLLIGRLAFGAGEGPMAATTNKTITNWFPREETGRMVGVTFAGQPIGTALAGPVVGLIAVATSWRVSFFVIAIIGLVWTGFWWVLMRERPADHLRVSPDELRLIECSRSTHVPLVHVSGGSILDYLKKPSVLAVAAVLFSANYVLYFFLSWLPSYLTATFHLDIARMSIISVIPWLCGALGYICGGMLSDFLFRKTGNGVFARKMIAILGLSMAALCVVLTAIASSVTMAILLIAIANFFLLMTPQAGWALVQEIVPATRVGAVGGFCHLLSNISGVIGPSVTGFAVQYGGGYTSSFLLAGAVAILGAVTVLLLLRTSPSLTVLQAIVE